MMTLRYDVKEMTREIERLPHRRRVIFAAACAERLLPAYAAFTARTGRGDPPKLTGLLERLWQDLAGELMTDEELQSSIETSTSMIPHEEDGPWVLEVGPAENAATSVTYALRCRRSGRSEEAEWAARGAYDAVDYFLVHRSDPPNPEVDRFPDLEDEVVHPLMQTALARQRRDLDELVTAEGDDSAIAASLRDRARAEASTVLADA